jgi:peroxiredoxin Q/BCP
MMKLWVAAAAVLILAASPARSEDAAPVAGLKIGDMAPVFQARDDAGDLWKSSNLVGEKILVVYFYPAAMTGGCTKQACGFRDDRDFLTEMGAEVVGVSGDTPEGLAMFKHVHGLNFTLLADTDGAVAKAFGVPLRDGGAIQRNVDGKEVTLNRGVTASRWTFAIGLDGRVAYANTKVKAAQDSKDVIEFVKSLLPKDEELSE